MSSTSWDQVGIVVGSARFIYVACCVCLAHNWTKMTIFLINLSRPEQGQFLFWKFSKNVRVVKYFLHIILLLGVFSSKKDNILYTTLFHALNPSILTLTQLWWWWWWWWWWCWYWCWQPSVIVAVLTAVSASNLKSVTALNPTSVSPAVKTNKVLHVTVILYNLWFIVSKWSWAASSRCVVHWLMIQYNMQQSPADMDVWDYGITGILV